MLSRREMLWMAMFAGSPSVLSKKGRRARFPKTFWNDPKSPPTTPFVRPLPLPPPPRRSAAFALTDCEAPFPNGFSRPIQYYRMIQEEVLVELHPDLPLTPVWRYRDRRVPRNDYGDAFGGFMAGPTIIARMKRPIAIRMRNNLPVNHVGFGVNHTTMHYHGGHVEARSDGFPEQGHAPNPTFDPIILPGEEYDYCYAMQDTGFSIGEPDPDERPATQWYHDHLLDFTGPNVQRGLAGFLLVYDNIDTGDESRPTARNLRLPSLARPDGSLPGFDIPMLFKDRRVAPDGSLIYLPEDFDGFLGDKRMVNGRIDPFLEVEQRKYRLRFLNGANARMMLFHIVDETGNTHGFDMIGNDGGLFAHPIRGAEETPLLSPAERSDIVVDFSRFPAGTKLYIEDAIIQDDGRGPGGDFEDPERHAPGAGTKVLEFRVVPATGPDNSQVPDVLRPITPIPRAEIQAARRRRFEFERTGGAWAINGEFVDIDRPCARVPANTGEVWTLENGGGWWHPIHIHLEMMRVLRRNGKRPPLHERDGFAKKDTVNLGPGDEVKVFVKFRDFKGPYVFHCHNIEHEDHFMMCRYDVV